MPKTDETNREALIVALRAEVEKQEQAGQFNTVHHEMLENLLKDEKPKPAVKQEKNNG